jgi:hypothetical protein
MAQVARGKALVAKLRKQPGVRDAEALAAWIGRFKKARKAGKGVAAAKKAADGGDSKSDSKPVKAKKPEPFRDDDLDFDNEGEETPEQKRQRKYEERQIRDLEKAERSRFFSVIQEAGGIQTRADLREEYQGIPNTFKRKDGLPGDEIADYLNTYYPEFGIENERDLIDYFGAA